MHFVWIFFLFLSDALRPKPKADCPEENLALICDSYCYKDFLTCTDSCETSGCERECLSRYTDCYDACPCFSKCPNGCSDCENSICSCVSPELNNNLYKQCIDEAATDLSGCIKNCTASRTCYDECYSAFAETSDECPCNAKCELGCPCENGYKCQPFITAICEDTSYQFGYVISANAHYKENRYYNSPQGEIPFIVRSGNAILNGEMMIFGGTQSPRKIGKISGCDLVDTGKRLIYDFDRYYGSLTTIPELHEETVLCQGTSTKCESFDGTVSLALSDTKIQHRRSCMATYDFQAVIVAGSDTESVELLAFSGWRDEPPHPAGNIYAGDCVSIEHGILMISGWVSSGQKTVYMFRDEKWTTVGELQNPFAYGTMIMFDDFFLVYAGVEGVFTGVERAEWNGNEVTSSRVLFEHDGDCYRPIVFESDPDQCSQFCTNDFCYV